ncbi:MAG TPA: HAD family hydrolase [Parachlamydiaceae bacterium]|nr:HAD family hydrolase [Parachlamydiaceae bacterium]
MKKKMIPMAIAYDFDGTLASGNMQEYDFVPALGMTPKDFWNEATELETKHQADKILAYMHLMIQKASAKQLPIRKEDFIKYGNSVDLFEGVTTWFERVNAYAETKNVELKHYIISSGIKEMIEGTPIAKEFHKIFASSFMYDHHGIAFWPALAINYTTKTQYLFRINKGSLDVCNHTQINKFIPDSERPLPFEHMIFIGDGETDIPSFKLVKEQRGHAIAVYKPRTPNARETSQSLINDGRVNFIAPACYTEGSEIDIMVKTIIDKIVVDNALVHLV